MKVTTDGCLFGAWIAERVRSQESLVGSVLDVGTGTGLLTLMVAQANKFAIDTIEIDKEAFLQASANIAASPWARQINIFHVDVKNYEFRNKYDVIICNPPFYEKELKGDDTKKNIAHHNEGLLLPELLNIIKKNLNQDGHFYLLLPYKRNEEIKKLLTENQLTIQQLTFVRQSINHDHFRIMLSGKLNSDVQTEMMIDEISIKDNNDQYTTAFKSLLKDFYLHF